MSNAIRSVQPSLCCLIIFALVLVPVPARTDITPMDYYAAPTGGSVSPKSPHPAIGLKSQEVIIRLRPETYKVDAVFHLSNTGETSTEWIGFPKNAMGRQPGPKGGIADFIRFDVRVNEQKVPFKDDQEVVADVEQRVKPLRSRPRPRSSWLVGQAVFPGQSTTTVRVRYEAWYDNCGMGCEKAVYIYGTGGYWKDGIGKASFIIDCTEQGGVEQAGIAFACSVRRTQISTNLVRYEFKDLRPHPLDLLSITFVRGRSFRKGDARALNTGLSNAALNGRLEQVQALLNKGADVNAQVLSRTPLMSAAAGGHLSVVKLLVDKGANVKAQTKDGRTALDSVSVDSWQTRKHLEVARFLVSKGATPNNLEVAAFVGDLEAARRFLEQGMSHTAKGSFKDPRPLRAASVGGQLEMIKLLLDKGYKVDEKNERGETPLMAAAAAGHAEVVKLLLDRGANVHARDGHRRPALNHAVWSRGHVDVVKVLLDRGADVNARDDGSERTILMHAAQGGFLDVVKLLMDRGANVNARDYSGKTALSLAKGKDIEEIERVLKARGGTK